jgi:hypothetical protein
LEADENSEKKMENEQKQIGISNVSMIKNCKIWP